ncbi:hypothetical protein D4764_0229440 [Takifugu flavidus]|uniref:Immunoglobulin domain-containing protein n=1 Tax=Takifugu flavidus TaxID=433684 RepID=A0A5C6MEB3_9TELE|nr:hypothetical protein D4764_0229440 [Takifugu flavidus]
MRVVWQQQERLQILICDCSHVTGEDILSCCSLLLKQGGRRWIYLTGLFAPVLLAFLGLHAWRFVPWLIFTLNKGWSFVTERHGSSPQHFSPPHWTHREKKVFTVTIKDVREGDTDFWCVVEINGGRDDGTYFQVSVTRDVSSLYVDHQEVTGFNGGQTTIKCYYQNSGQAKWCRVGGPCVTQSQGSIDGTTVFINETPPRVFTVTMSGLKMEDSGWYWCSRGDLQMPVQIIVREKPSTTAQPETFTSPELVSPSTTNEAEKPSTTDETEKPSTTDEAEKPSTTDEDAPNSLSGSFMIVIISLSLLIFFVILSSLIWFCIKRQKQIQEEPSAEMLAEDTVIYTNMRGKRKPPVKPLKPESTKHSVSFPKRGCRRTVNIKTYENHHISTLWLLFNLPS